MNHTRWLIGIVVAGSLWGGAWVPSPAIAAPQDAKVQAVIDSAVNPSSAGMKSL